MDSTSFCSSICLVTGGAGFIGSHLVRRLLDLGVHVRIVDNLSTGQIANLNPVIGNIELIEGDIRDDRLMSRATQGVDTVFHMAAIASVPLSVANPRLTFDVNVAGTLNVLVAARDAGCRRIVFSSSCAVYGNVKQLPTIEHIHPAPMSPYATSKLNGEQLCSVFSTVYGLGSISLRYFNVFGPRQDPDSPYAAALPRFLSALREGERITIFGDGEQTRDFVFVDNVVDANLAASQTAFASGDLYNIGSGTHVTINDAVSLMAQYLGVLPHVEHAPPRDGDLRHSLASISAAQSGLGYEVRVPFEKGIQQLILESVGSPL